MACVKDDSLDVTVEGVFSRDIRKELKQVSNFFLWNFTILSSVAEVAACEK